MWRTGKERYMGAGTCRVPRHHARTHTHKRTHTNAHPRSAVAHRTYALSHAAAAPADPNPRQAERASRGFNPQEPQQEPDRGVGRRDRGRMRRLERRGSEGVAAHRNAPPTSSRAWNTEGGVSGCICRLRTCRWLGVGGRVRRYLPAPYSRAVERWIWAQALKWRR